MNKELLKEYADIKNKIKLLEDESLILKEQVLQELKKEEVDTVQTDFGTFSVAQLKDWKYTKVYEQLHKQLLARKAEEQEKQLATFIINYSLIYRPIKL